MDRGGVEQLGTADCARVGSDMTSKPVNHTKYKGLTCLLGHLSWLGMFQHASGPQSACPDQPPPLPREPEMP